MLKFVGIPAFPMIHHLGTIEDCISLKTLTCWMTSQGKWLGFILWAPWVFVPHFLAIHPNAFFTKKQKNVYLVVVLEEKPFYHLETMQVCTNFCINPSYKSWNISVQTGRPADWPWNIFRDTIDSSIFNTVIKCIWFWWCFSDIWVKKTSDSVIVYRDVIIQ